MTYYVCSYSGDITMVSFGEKFLKLAKPQNLYTVFTLFTAENDSF